MEKLVSWSRSCMYKGWFIPFIRQRYLGTSINWVWFFVDVKKFHYICAVCSASNVKSKYIYVSNDQKYFFTSPVITITKRTRATMPSSSLQQHHCSSPHPIWSPHPNPRRDNCGVRQAVLVARSTLPLPHALSSKLPSPRRLQSNLSTSSGAKKKATADRRDSARGRKGDRYGINNSLRQLIHFPAGFYAATVGPARWCLH